MKGGEGKGEEDMEFEKMDRAIWKLKKGKMAEEDEIQNEVWLWEGGGLRRAIREICSMVWNAERWRKN